MPSRTERIVPLLALGGLAGLLLLVVFVAGGKFGNGDGIDAQARRVIKEAGDYLRLMQAFHVTLETDVELSNRGNKESLQILRQLDAARPNKLNFSVSTESGQGVVVCDGEQLFVQFERFNKYLALSAPSDWSGIIGNPIVDTFLSVDGSNVIIDAMLTNDPAERLLALAGTITYGGIVPLDGRDCHLIEGSGEHFNWKLWVDAGDKPLLRQYAPEVRTPPASIEKQDVSRPRIETITMHFRDWQTNPELSAETFAYHPPAGSERINSPNDLPVSYAETLVGKPAPPIKLPLLDGGELDLAALKSKNLVVLDFWASWCGPCLDAMPIVSHVTEHFRDQGAILYTVNVGESRADVTRFVDRLGIILPVALDEFSTAAAAYQVSSMPTTVVIGKDGIVHVVHIGYSEDLEEKLLHELDRLVRAENPAATDGEAQPADAPGDSAAPADADADVNAAPDKANP